MNTKLSSKYRFVNTDGVYFVTSTVVDWVDVFTKDGYRDILMDSFRFCQEKQGLQIYGWVLMTNQLGEVMLFDLLSVAN